MNRFCMIACAVAVAAADLAAAELQTLWWSKRLNAPERFDRNSSGRVTVSRDEAEQAVRFDVEFTPETDFWVYPRLRFRGGESFAGVDEIRFEFKAKQQGQPGGYKHAYLMFNSAMPYVALPTPKEEWQQVVIPVAGSVKDPAAVNHIAIGMNPRSPRLTYWIRNLELRSSRPRAIVPDTAEIVIPAAPGTVFTQEEPLEFSLESSVASPVRWTLKDWRGKVLRTGDWPEGGKGKLRLDSLPDGYYLLTLESDTLKFSGSRSFAVVPSPSSRRRNPETFFAMDSAQSWLARPNPANCRHPQDGYATVSEVARRAGLEMVRERLSWNQCEPAPGRFQWGQYMTNAEELSRRGVKISGMYHDAAAYARGNNKKLPVDLLATYQFAKTLARVFQGKMSDWEFWNEQDIGFAPEAAWEYASAMKAAYLGFKAGDPDLPVALGGIANAKLPNYCNIMLENGLKDYFDIFNIHTYASLCEYPELLAGIQAYLKRHDIAERPIWFTENGCTAEGSGRDNSYIPGLKAHSAEQELLVAEFLPKTMLSMQSLGVDRNFFFVLPPYNEQGGAKDWGLMRRDFSVKPGYVAFSNLMHQLGSATLEGSVELGSGIRGFLYRQPDGTQTLAYWSLSEVDTEINRPNRRISSWLERPFAIDVKRGSYAGTDIFGTPFRKDAPDGKLQLTATRMIAYVNGLSGLKPSVPFHKGKKAGAPRRVEYDRSIIFRVELSKDFTLSGGKDSVDVEKDNAALVLEVWNLSDRKKSGRVEISGCTVSGLPEKVTVPPFGKVRIPLAVTPVFDRDFQGKMRVGGKFEGKDVSALVMPFLAREQLLAESRKEPLGAMMDPVNWRANTSGKMTIEYREPEQALEFKTRFPVPGDWWVYPEYVLQLPQESLKGAYGISFEVKAIPASGIKQMLLMAVYGRQQEQGRSVYLKVPTPTERWEERVVLFNPAEVDPAKIEQLRLGVNSNVDEITYFVRNVRVLFAR